MDTLLLIVTGVSLVAALFLGWIAWRLARAERERELARVAALAAAVDKVEVPTFTARSDRSAETSQPERSRVDIPLPTRPRSSPRIAAVRPAVADEIEWAPPRPEEIPASAPAPVARQADPDLRLRTEPVQTPVMHEAFLGSTAAASNGGQRGLAVAAVILLFLLGAAGAWLYSRPSATAVVASMTSQTPLELISLQHVRDGDRISVSGLVRNPASAQNVERLQATVLLFDQQGGYLTSTRSFVDVPHLGPGEESPFTLSMQAPTGATRYRVSFRTEEHIVPHVDRRDATPAAQTTAQPANAAAR